MIYNYLRSVVDPLRRLHCRCKLASRDVKHGAANICRQCVQDMNFLFIYRTVDEAAEAEAVDRVAALDSDARGNGRHITAMMI